MSGNCATKVDFFSTGGGLWWGRGGVRRGLFQPAASPWDKRQSMAAVGAKYHPYREVRRKVPEIWHSGPGMVYICLLQIFLTQRGLVRHYVAAGP